jgi:hypothetical protein
MSGPLSRLRLFAAALTFLVALAAGGGEARAWGATGHRLISRIAVEALPEEMPEFLRRPDSLADIGELGREPDRWRDAGRIHDAERDPGHFIDLAEDLTVMGALPLAPLFPTREAYDGALRARGVDQSKAGYLPYSIIDGWQQLAKDFAYWRAETAALQHVIRQQDYDWLARDRRLRARLILRDLGVWSHYVADGSQPLHVSIHYNGWGNYPNPAQFTTANTTHAFFEGEFVRRNIGAREIAALLPPYRECGCGIEQRTLAFLTDSAAMVVPFYTLEKQGAFANATPEGRAFAAQRLAAGAAALRDMILDAWRASLDATVGYPAVSVRDVEAGKIVPVDQLMGLD